MNIYLFIEMIKALFAGIGLGFKAFLSVLPIYEALSSIKEFLIAQVLGVPVWVISIIFAIPTIFGIVKKLLS